MTVPQILRQPSRRFTALGVATVLVLVVIGTGADVAAQQPPSGCPPDPQLQSCRITVDLTNAVVRADGFTPNSSVTFEVFESIGGPVIYGPFTRSTDGDGRQLAQLRLVPGNYVIVTDVATSTQKTREVSPLTIEAVDVAADTVSGTARPGDRVEVVVGSPQEFGSGRTDTVADSAGNWTAEFGTVDVDITEQTSAYAEVRDADGDATSAQPTPGCPPVGPTCRLEVEMVEDRISANAFTPDSSIRFEVFESVGGTLLHAATRQTDAAGVQLIHPPVDLVAGHYIVVTDVATSFQKTIELSSLSIEVMDLDADTVSGTARPGDEVFVDLTADRQYIEVAVADAAGVWTADFRARGADLNEQTRINIVYVFDADGDSTGTGLGPGCRLVGGFICSIGSSIEHDSFLVFGFTPNSQVSFEIFDAPGGSSIYGPVTRTTDRTGTRGLDFGLRPGPDLVPGTYLEATDLATGTVKTLELADVSIDRVDPDTNVVEGRAPPGTTVGVNGFDSPRGTQVVSDEAGTWRADFTLVGYDFTFEDYFFASVNDEDGDSTSDQLGAPIQGCVDDADTTCGSAAPDTIRESDGEVISGLGGDTLLISSDDPSASVRIVAGSGSDGIVLPAHAGRLDISVFGGAGADRMITRSFGGGGASSGSYFLDGGGGNDSMRGGDGDDTLHGGGGANDFSGGPGVDTCLSDTNRDRFQGCERIRRNHRRNHGQI